ncbi:MAG: right-handed parallel beta-helix repeat-containing protein [Candidatus Heimdallarchaeaceae archaeon]
MVKLNKILFNKNWIIASLTIIFIITASLLIVFITINPYSLKDHAPIIIWENSDFDKYNFDGKGTIDEPYLIANYNITTSAYAGIQISGTTVFFRIENCYINADLYGINIENIALATASLINNTCEGNVIGISIVNSNHVKIQNNNCNKNSRKGISLILSVNSIVNSNICQENNEYGLFISNSPKTIVTNNTLSSNLEYGLYIILSKDSSLVDNLFFNSGLFIDDSKIEQYTSYSITNNSINNSPITIIKNKENEIFSVPNEGQIFFINCSNIEIKDSIIDDVYMITFAHCNDLVIQNNEITNLKRPGLTLRYCNNSYVTENNCSFNAFHGLLIYDSLNTHVYQNIFENNSYCGIVQAYSYNSTITNNICRYNYRNDPYNDENTDGILVVYSSEISLINNTCNFNNDDGISLYYSPFSKLYNNTCESNGNRGIAFWKSSNSIADNNTCILNGHQGIYLRYSDNVSIFKNELSENHYGIQVFGSSFCNFSYNNIQNNSLYGISYTGELEYNSNNNSITFNLILGSNSYGLNLIDGNYTLVHHNAFIDNFLAGTSQGYDSTSYSLWYEDISMEGNYWSNFLGGNYSIDGPSGSQDLYPLLVNPLS